MCGRFGFDMPRQVLEEQFGIKLEGLAPNEGIGSDYNIAPGRPVLAVLPKAGGTGRGERELRAFHWGLVPAWSRNPTKYMINARSETVFEKPSFKAAMRHRRCLIPATLFYEWQKGRGKTKTPHAISLTDRRPMAFAAIHDFHEATGPTLAILTTSPNTLMASIHDRMPVIVAPEHYDLWLDAAALPKELSPLFHPYPTEEMHSWPISAQVNSPTNNGPEIAEPINPRKAPDNPTLLEL